MELLDKTPVTTAMIKSWTRHDPTLAKVTQYIQLGWPDSVPDHLKPFKYRSQELTIQEGCVLWGNRVIIPPQGRNQLLVELHDSHPGISRMKALARTYFWWPGLDNDIIEQVRDCNNCQVNNNRAPLAPLQPWQRRTTPWSRIHVDYAGPIKGQHAQQLGVMNN